MDDVMRRLKRAQWEIEHAIIATPTGRMRNALCDINILLLAALENNPIDIAAHNCQ